MNEKMSLCDVLLDVTLREGSQQYSDFRGLPVEDKLKIFQLQKEAGIKKIELTAFAPGDWFSDADALASGVMPHGEDLDIYGLYFNIRGAERLLQFPSLKRHGIFHTALTPSYREKNYNQLSVEVVHEKLKGLLEWFQANGLVFDVLLLSTAFGGRKEGIDSPNEAIEFIGKMIEVSEEIGLTPGQVTLADTEGVAGSLEISRLVSGVKRAFPELLVALHLHPPRSVARDSVVAGLEAGADRWEASWLGVGGSPLADGAGGNLDILVLVEEFERLGYVTGINQSGKEKLLTLIQDIRREAAQ